MQMDMSEQFVRKRSNPSIRFCKGLPAPVRLDLWLTGPHMIFVGKGYFFSCLFQSCVGEKMGSERQSGLPWVTVPSLRDTSVSAPPSALDCCSGLGPERLLLETPLAWGSPESQTRLGSCMQPSPHRGLLEPECSRCARFPSREPWPAWEGGFLITPTTDGHREVKHLPGLQPVGAQAMHRTPPTRMSGLHSPRAPTSQLDHRGLSVAQSAQQ